MKNSIENKKTQFNINQNAAKENCLKRKYCKKIVINSEQVKFQYLGLV